jgi:hypothetical protein
MMMAPMFKFTALAVSGLVLSACVPNPDFFETPPVTIETAQGPVTCQLYSPEIVKWDRAINRPDTMSVAEGDAVCQEAGQKQMADAIAARAGER